MLSVNKRGHKACPWRRPLLNLIWSYVSSPYFVLATIRVFHREFSRYTTFLSIPATGDALISFLATDDQQNRSPFSHRCSTYASSAVMTDLAIFLVSIVPLHPSLAPLRYPYMRSFSFKCLFTGPSKR